MRTSLPLALVALLALSGPSWGPLHGQAAIDRPRAVPGEFIVKFRDGAQERDKARARAGAARVTELLRGWARRDGGALELVRLPAGPGAQAVIAALQRDPAVEYAEPNWIHTRATNDPSFGQQWALENTGQSVSGYRGTAGADIRAVQAWKAVSNAQSIFVGVIDEGIDYFHPDLGVQPGGPIWTNPFDPVDGIDNDGNGYVDDKRGWDFAAGDNSVYDGSSSNPSIDSHGTHVAGIIGAKTGNGLGIAGVSPGVTLIPAKFLGASGGTTAHAIMALDYLTDLKIRHGLNIVATNNSWGGGGYSQALLEAIARAARQHILFVASAGNGGADNISDDNDRQPYYPASYNTTALAGYNAVISVTATGQSDDLPPWANFGFTSVDLGAPGSLILSTTPQKTYSYSNGTSMAAPHVTGAIALVHKALGLTGPALRDAILANVDPVPSLAGKTTTGGRLNVARSVGTSSTTVGGTASGTTAEIVLYPAQASTVVGNWSVRADSTAATGARMQSANRSVPKINPALASPSDYFEMTFYAEKSRAYRLWLRGRAENDYYGNDAVHVQFDGAVTSAGAAIWRIGTTSSTSVILEDCVGCGLSGWGWQDNGFGSGVLGPLVYFATTGKQRVRVQIREDGIGIDQLVLSSVKYLSKAPGALKNDTTVLGPDGAPATSGPSTEVNEIVLYAADAPVISSGWVRTADSTAAGGARLQNPNLGAATIKPALASPPHYFELVFKADAGKRYRLWIRGKAGSDSWSNDSVHVQFSGSVDGSGTAAWRIGTTSSVSVILEDCLGCGVSGWGWQDNGFGAGVLGPEIRFAHTGTQRLRIQVREDGFGIDQVVLSAVKYLSRAPGTLKNDTTILSRQ